MSWQTCPHCCGSGYLGYVSNLCVVCKGKRIINEQTGKPPKEEEHEMEYPRQWEEINNDKMAGCARLKIFGGWLVVSWSNEHPAAEPLIFIPDVSHQWELEAKQ